MKRWGICCAIFAACFFAAITLAGANRSGASLSIHHFELPCDKCHVTESSGETQGQLESTWKLTKDINKSCTLSNCHNFDPMLSHPVGIKPKGPIPKEMPLDSRSNITCLTCHQKTVDVNDFDYSEFDSDSQYLVRRPAGKQLCRSCHVKSNSMANEHWLFSGRAHLQDSDDKYSTANKLNISFGGIDRESRTCLSCHDDIGASISTGSTSRGRKMANHPIGMDYMSIALRNRSYKNVSNSNSGIRLFNGKVGCGSCHSLYADTDSHLIADHKDSTLCRKCHDL